MKISASGLFDIIGFFRPGGYGYTPRHLIGCLNCRGFKEKQFSIVII